MNWLDLLILLALGLSGLTGWALGLVRTLSVLLGLILALFAAGRLGEPLGGHLGVVHNPNGARVLGFFIVLGLVALAALAGGALMRQRLPAVSAGWDRVGGALLGIPAALLFLSGSVAALGSFPFGSVDGAVNGSELTAFLTRDAPMARGLLSERYRDVLAYGNQKAEAPKASLAAIGVVEASRERIAFRVEVTLENPNPFGGAIQNVEYQLLWEQGGQRVVLGDLRKEGEPWRLRAQGLTKVSLGPVTVDPVRMPAAGELVKQILAGDSVRLTAQGRLAVAFRPETLTVSFQGSKPVLRPE